MKYLNLICSFVLIVSLVLLQSCGDDDGTNEESCVNDVFGTWEVTSFIPSTANCDALTTYQIGRGTDDNILTLSIVDGSRTLTGNGLINATCSEMTYTVSQGQTIVSGTIIFNGTMLEDRSDLGCLVSASKR